VKKKLMMGVVLAGAVAIALQAGVGRPAIAAVEAGLDGKYGSLWPNVLMLVLWTTRGLYLDNYGAVFTTELNLVSAPPRTPMTPPVPNKPDIDRMFAQKIDRVTKLKAAMRGFLADTATSLDMVPPDQQVVLAVTLSRYQWEPTGRLPGHIVMQAKRSDLLQARTAGPAALEQAVRVQEY
jgi:hypothetical protein